MYLTFQGDNGIEYAIGVAKVILKKDMPHPYFRDGKKYTVCNFSGETMREKTEEKDPETGKTVYETKYMNFSAFGKLARLCRNFEHNDKFIFFGRVSVDKYWSEHNSTGEVQYKVTLEAVIPQFTEDMLGNVSSGGGYDDGDDESYYNDFYGGPGY